MTEIRFDRLTFSYETTPVFLNFTAGIQKNRVTCLFGPSGSGKTTLGRLLLALEKPQSGHITGLDGMKAAAVFQEDRLLPQLTAVQNIGLVMHSSFSSADIRAHLRSLDLPEESFRHPVSTYSGGMKRRVALARAVMANRPLIVLDEPFKGLDEKTKERAIAYLAAHKQDKTILLITHDEEDARPFDADILRLTTLPRNPQ